MTPDAIRAVKGEATVGQLIGALATDTGALVRQELHLAATEMTETAGIAARNAGYVAAGGAILHIATIALLAGLIAWLHQFVPIWASAGGVGLILAIVGGVFLTRGLKALKHLDPVPRNTLSTLAPTVFDQREPAR